MVNDGYIMANSCLMMVVLRLMMVDDGQQVLMVKDGPGLIHDGSQLESLGCWDREPLGPAWRCRMMKAV